MISNNNQKGVSLIITFFIMVIILAVVLSVSVLLYSEVRIVKNTGDSMSSIFAADSGIEKVLYYNRQVIPSGASRGLCAMFDSVNNNSQYCNAEYSPTKDQSIYCQDAQSQIGVDAGTPGYNNSMVSTLGCNYDECSNCQISFNSVFGGRSYNITAKVYPYIGGGTAFSIDSRGSYNSAQRQVQIIVTPSE